MIEEAYERLDHVERKLLAKSAGKSLEEVPKAIIPTFRVMNSVVGSYSNEERKINDNVFFTALCIRCLYEGTEGIKISPEEVVKKARNNKNLTSVQTFDKRISALMSCSEQAFFIDKYARLFKYISKLMPSVIPDGDQLYKDMLYSTNSSKSVQRQWARVIYTEVGFDETKEEE